MKTYLKYKLFSFTIVNLFFQTYFKNVTNIKIKIFQSLDACSKFFTTLIKQSPNILYYIHKNIFAKNLKEHHLIFQHSRKYFLENQFPVKEHQFQEAHFDS